MATMSHPPRPCRLSVAMAVRDEEHLLARTIDSIRPVADEILVLDTGSADQTPALAARMGARVSHAPWTDDFAAARNRLLAEASGDWVLWLDAGERLTSESAADLRTFLDEAADPGTVYLLMVEVPPATPGASAEQAARPRLMPRHPDLRFTGRVRETIEPSIQEAGLAVDFALGRIARHHRQHDPERKALSAQRNLKLVALEATEGGSPEPRLLLALGEACADLGDASVARRAFRQALRLAPRGSSEMLEAYYGLLATFDGEDGRRNGQLPACLEALEIYPHDAQLLCALGSYWLAEDRPDLAVRAFQTADRHGKVDPRTWHLVDLAEMTAAFLGLTLQTQGKDEEARRVLEDALARHENSARLRRHLIDLCVKHGQSDQAIRLADAMAVVSQQRKPLQDAVRGACKAARQDWLAALGLLQSAYVAGCRDPLCLRWLAVTLLSNGQVEAAEPVLHEWLRVEPEDAEAQAYLKMAREQRPVEPARPGPAAAQSGESGESRWLRVDPPATVMDLTPICMPILCQAASRAIAEDATLAGSGAVWDESRQIRVDSGTTIIEATPVRMPILCQASSIDPIPRTQVS